MYSVKEFYGILDKFKDLDDSDKKVSFIIPPNEEIGQVRIKLYNMEYQVKWEKNNGSIRRLISVKRSQIPNWEKYDLNFIKDVPKDLISFFDDVINFITGNQDNNEDYDFLNEKNKKNEKKIAKIGRPKKNE